MMFKIKLTVDTNDDVSAVGEDIKYDKEGLDQVRHLILLLYHTWTLVSIAIKQKLPFVIEKSVLAQDFLLVEVLCFH
jgi:hypothetical protein